MKVLVTGSAGFLGRAFVQHHLEQGDEVIEVDDLSNPRSRWLDRENRPRHRAQLDAATWFNLNGDQRFELAYHFAAPVGGRMKIEGDPLFNADSLRLDAAFFRWATQDHVGTAVYPSSSAVYPVRLQTEDDSIALAESEFQPDQYQWGQPDEVYGLTKLVGEVLAWKSAAYGLSTLCIRPFSGYGEDQSTDYPVSAIARRVALRDTPVKIWGSGTQSRDFVHVSDIVGATIARLAKGVPGFRTMNIGSGVATTFYELADLLVDIAGDRTYQPGIGTEPRKPEGVKHRYADTTRMENFYQLQVPLREGLRRVLAAQR